MTDEQEEMLSDLYKLIQALTLKVDEAREILKRIETRQIKTTEMVLEIEQKEQAEQESQLYRHT